MKHRSVVRTGLRLLFFAAWLAVGVIGLGVYFLGGAGDRYEQFAHIATELESGSSAPTTGAAAPGAFASPAPTAESAESLPPIAGPADIDTGGGPGEPAPAVRVSEESQPESGDLWYGMTDEAIGDSFGSGGLGMSGTGKGGGGTGEGSIGLGNIGTIGKGSGTTYGSAAAGTKPPVAAVPSKTISAPEAPAEDEAISGVDQKLANLPLGNIAFNTPETIPLGDSARIELLVSLKQAEEELRRAVRAEGPVDTARVKISDQMEARLTGLGFRIEAITPERQAVTRGEPTQWQWQIEPNKSATLELHLTLSALIEVDGVPATRAVRTFERTIYVEVPIANRVSDFLAGHLELLLSFVLIPVAGGAYRYVRNRRKRGGPPDEAPPAKWAA